ncbi:hypothetical protein LVD17_22295 [Fulvivirga ulvae]|uniref:hypothetical protein n=1 Tax=Fulvivirga ulvae TaxID=2904245 RepID=UPI001F1844A1|nr:hypothetical protein [Fulvivirga ulvae]UII31027.1 hypothetical protein LVD17_22295 [Fulvivirga ulvae]
MRPVFVIAFLTTFSTLAAYMAVAGISFLEHESLLKEAKQKAILEMPKIDGPVVSTPVLGLHKSIDFY